MDPCVQLIGTYSDYMRPNALFHMPCHINSFECTDIDSYNNYSLGCFVSMEEGNSFKIILVGDVQREKIII